MLRKEAKAHMSKGAASGMVALVFLILGFQLAIFVVKVVERPDAVAEMPDQVRHDAGGRSGHDAGGRSGHDEVDQVRHDGVGQTSSPAPTGDLAPTGKPVRATGSRTKYGGYPHPAGTGRPARKAAGEPRRSVESFPFDPNTVTVEDLVRLGLSPRQAETIENYRTKGGRFRAKTDFQKMYVVSDTLYARLEPYIEIPKIDLNAADSAALVSLRGIGPWYARKILDYRERLGGFWRKEQLLEIDGIDAERFAGFADEVCVMSGPFRKLDLWHAPDSVLTRHPYVGPKGARSIVRYRQLYDSTRWTLPDLAREHVLPEENIEKLKKYIESQ